MNPSEELMCLLELNGFDITKYKLKKQLEYEQTGNTQLYRYKKYADLLVSHYSFTDNTDYFHRNPLTYRPDWGKDVQSIDQFYVTHPEFDGEMTLKEFFQLDTFNEVTRESILYDILDGWVEEYRESSITQMENLKEMIKRLPKKSKKYRKPRKAPMIFTILLAILLIMLFKNPTALQPSFFSFLADFVSEMHGLLFDVDWYSFLGFMAIIIIAGYAVANNAMTRFIRDIRSEKNKHADATFAKWENDMKKSRLKQSGVLEDYVDRVIKNPKKSELLITDLYGPEKLMAKFKKYVLMIEGRFDRMTKYYSLMMLLLRLLFVLAILMFIAFIGVGFAMLRGWISVV